MDELIAEMYKALELSDTASEMEIDEAYRRLVKQYQSDQMSDDQLKKREAWDKLKEISMAYDTLKNYLSEKEEIKPKKADVQDSQLNQPFSAGKTRKSGRRIAVIIMVAVCISIGYYFYTNKRTGPANVAGPANIVQEDVRIFTSSG
jgi:hypothetical protein